MKFIKEGYCNINSKFNDTLSLLSYIKIANNDINNYYLYDKYFRKSVDEMNKKFTLNYTFKTNIKKKDKPKKIDQMKIESYDSNKNNVFIFESVLIEICEKFLHEFQKKSSKYTYYYFSLFKLNSFKIDNVNTYIVSFINFLITKYTDDINLNYVIENSQTIIEKNDYVNKFSDIQLFNHQKEIFSLFKKRSSVFNYDGVTTSELQASEPKLVLYIAPTATGKTLSPIGLSEEYKVIFVCLARHVGLALAKSALSIGKKIALAFNCSDATDIELNYAAGNTWFRHELNENGFCSCGRKNCKLDGQYITYKNGSRKNDHSDGSAVEIIICDIKSYTSNIICLLSIKKKILLLFGMNLLLVWMKWNILFIQLLKIIGKII